MRPILPVTAIKFAGHWRCFIAVLGAGSVTGPIWPTAVANAAPLELDAQSCVVHTTVWAGSGTANVVG